MNIINDFINFLGDKSLTLSKKTILIVSIVFIVVVVDFWFGFSFNYSLNQRLNQIEKIELIKSNFNLPDSLNNQLGDIEFKIIYKKDYLNFLLWNFNKINNGKSLNTNKVEPDTSSMIGSTQDSTSIRESPTIKSKSETYSKRKFFLDLVSSSYIFLLILIILPFIPLTQKENIANSYIGVIVIMIVIIGFTIVNYLLYSLIPTLSKPWINYLFNAILHFSIVYSIIKLISRSSKNKSK